MPGNRKRGLHQSTLFSFVKRGKKSSPEKTNQSLNEDESIDDPVPMQEDSIEVPPVLDLNINTDESDQDKHTTDKPNTDEHVLSVPDGILEQPPSSLDSDSEGLTVPAPAPISVEDDDSSDQTDDPADPVNNTDAAGLDSNTCLEDIDYKDIGKVLRARQLLKPKQLLTSHTADVEMILRRNNLPNSNIVRANFQNMKDRVTPKQAKKESDRFNPSSLLECVKDTPNNLEYIHYAISTDKMYCLCCSFFLSEHTNHLPKRWVDGFSDLNRIKTTDKKGLITHLQSRNHRDAKAKAKMFLNKNKVSAKFTLQSQSEKEANFQLFTASVNVIKCCAEQGLPLRGHRESFDPDKPHKNVGNFLAIMKLVGDNNPIVHKMLDEVQRKQANKERSQCTFLSNTFQNNVVKILGDLINAEIKKEVDESQAFSIIIDEGTAYNESILTIGIRYLYMGSDEPGKEKEAEVKEEWLTFNLQEKTTAKEIYKSVKDQLEIVKLKLKEHCIGGATDGAKVMTGSSKGVLTLLKEDVPGALGSHCYCHNLALVIGDTLDVPAAEKAVTTVQGMTVYFTSHSNKREYILNHIFKMMQPQCTRKKCLKKCCKTRWTPKFYSWRSFLENIKVIEITLRVLSGEKDLAAQYGLDPEEVGVDPNAQSHLNLIRDSSFLTGLVCLVRFLGPLEGPTIRLQGKAVDILEAHREIKQIQMLVDDIRQRINYFWDSEEYWPTILDLHKQLGIEAGTKRQCGRQTTRDNTPAENIKSYFRITVANPILDSLSMQLSTRFSEAQQDVVHLLHLHPSMLKNLDSDTKLDEFVDGVGSTLHQFKDMKIFEGISEQQVKAELRCLPMLWKAKNEDHKQAGRKEITELIDLYKFCKMSLKGVAALIQLLLTYPVTSADAERSISMLRRIYSWLRSSMTIQRLSSLGSIHLHPDRAKEIKVQEVYDIYYSFEGRRKISTRFEPYVSHKVDGEGEGDFSGSDDDDNDTMF